jgi:hypothetical protein
MTMFFDIETGVRLAHGTSTETADNLKTTEREHPEGASGVIFDASPDATYTAVSPDSTPSPRRMLKCLPI